jgi:hypothetical protein
MVQREPEHWFPKDGLMKETLTTAWFQREHDHWFPWGRNNEGNPDLWLGNPITSSGSGGVEYQRKPWSMMLKDEVKR